MGTIQVDQQIIRSLLENFDWEGNPKWKEELSNIETKIQIYWDTHKKFYGKRKPTGIP